MIYVWEVTLFSFKINEVFLATIPAGSIKDLAQKIVEEREKIRQDRQHGNFLLQQTEYLHIDTNALGKKFLSKDYPKILGFV